MMILLIEIEDTYSSNYLLNSCSTLLFFAQQSFCFSVQTGLNFSPKETKEMLAVTPLETKTSFTELALFKPNA